MIPEIIKNQFELLNAALKDSIRDEVRKITNEREQRMSESLIEKEKIFEDKMNNVYHKIEGKLSTEKEIISNLVKQSEIQMKQQPRQSPKQL